MRPPLLPQHTSHFAVPTARVHGWLPLSDASGIMMGVWPTVHRFFCYMEDAEAAECLKGL